MCKVILASLTALMMAACTSGERSLHDSRNTGGGPDEFAVLPVKSLEIPAEMKLPTPTPGGANRTDPNPKAAAIAALGGNAAVLQRGGVPASDAALVSAASRNGVSADIRATLADEDARIRKTRRTFSLFGGLFSRNGYFGAYANQALNAYAELQRFRQLGVATPSAPPAN